jgi:uncharacterized protein
MQDMIIITLASLLAGFVDAVVGGGGLVLVPTLFSVYPQTAPATLLGTNKAAAIWGTALAARQYAKRVTLRWPTLLPSATAALVGSFLGAWTVTLVSANGLRKALPFILIGVLAYTLLKKEMGRTHAPRFSGRQEMLAGCVIGLTLGFYDGFFGPGVGSFFVFLFVRWLGFDFLNASSSAKVLNTATNLAALVLFSLKGHIWWQVAAVMAVANVVGSLAGTHMALKHGTGFVRAMFIGVVSLLILKTGYDGLIRPYL